MQRPPALISVSDEAEKEKQQASAAEAKANSLAGQTAARPGDEETGYDRACVGCKRREPLIDRKGAGVGVRNWGVGFGTRRRLLVALIQQVVIEIKSGSGVEGEGSEGAHALAGPLTPHTATRYTTARSGDPASIRSTRRNPIHQPITHALTPGRYDPPPAHTQAGAPFSAHRTMLALRRSVLQVCTKRNGGPWCNRRGGN